MNLCHIHLPRELEADAGAAEIRRMLSSRTAKLWPGGTREAVVMPMSEPLKQVLVRARLKGRIRFGFEAIREKLASEKKGILHVRKPGGASEGNRISRLILFSDDGAERLYRHIEQLLQDHSPRVLGGLLGIDSHGLGKLITGQDRQVKVLMVEHKEAVSELLRAVTTHAAPPDR